MELDLSSQEHFYLKKRLFNLKTHGSDGLILQVHHSYSDSGGENKRYRFISASFNNHGTHLAVSDHKGHIFIINLEMERYWQLPHVGLPTVISFPVLKGQELLVGLDNTSIIFVHIDQIAEIGNVTGVLHGHSVPATEVSYSDDGYYYLTSCSVEAIVWDSSTCNQIHRLSLKQEVYLKKVLFMPVTNHILACFQDDTMHIWKFGSFECIKQIVPETWKTHHLKTIAITKNGRAMVIGGHSSNLVIFCLDTWAIKRVVEFPEQISGVKQIEFLSQVFDGGANKILVVLSASQDLFFFDIEALVFLKWMQKINKLSAKFTLSSNGKYLASILTSGEVNIYLTEKVLWSKKVARGLEEGYISNQNSGSRNHSSNSKKSQKTYESLSSIQKEIKEILDVRKLLPILKQYGEYPQLYRTLIWKTILKLPENQESFVSLSMRKCHPSYSKLEFKYPLANKSLCNSLKKLLSNLSYWCPLFGEVDFLPRFVFPFVKLFHSNPLICFEVVATVIVNWCQNWFEFFPFPPINLLSLLESILGYHDPGLLEFYFMNDVTSSISVCPLFHTAFSEVLTKAEWLKLWDHILSNEPSYLFMAIVAYNVICRNALKSLQNATEIEKFFHTQNSVDIKMLISKAYQYLKETPENIHTRQYFAPFRSLGSGGTYNTFLAYPKLIFDSSTERLQTIRREEETILDEEFKALSIKKALDKKVLQNDTTEEKEKIYEEIEEKIRKTVEEEEDRLLVERQKLQTLRQELKLKELEILKNTRDKALNEKIRRKELELERLLKDISKKKNREKVELDTIEKEIRNYYSDLLLRKCQLEMELGLSKSESNINGNLERQREKLRNDLTELQYEWDNSYHSKRIDLCNKIVAIKGLICDVETEIAKQMTQKNFEKQLKNDKMSVEELKIKVNLLEKEVENLLQKNLNKLQNQKVAQKTFSLRLPAKTESLRRLEKKTSNAKHDVKNTGISKTRRSAKCATKKTSTGSRSNIKKVTSARLSKPKLTKSSTEKQYSESLQDEWQSFINIASSNLTSENLQSPHRRSKLTQPADSQFYGPDSPANSEDYHQRSNLDISDVKFRQQPQGDCLGDRQFSTGHKSLKKKKKENASNNKVKKDSSLSDSIDEVLKSALKARSQIINEAKRRQKFP